MPKFFVTATNIFGGVAYIKGKDADHMRVLRIRPGEIVTVCDSDGTDYKCRVTSSGDGQVEAEIIETSPSRGEPSVKCSVFAAFSKGDRLETAIQKCVELGAGRIVLFPSARCISRPEGAALIKKLARYRKIASEAAMQSGRGKIPDVIAVTDFKDAVAMASQADLPLFFYEEEKERGLKSALLEKGTFETVSVFTGPEGGFQPEEAEFAVSSGMISVSLGPRILRSETAPICGVAAVMCLSGEMEPKK